MATYKFKRYSVEELEIEADNLEQARQKAVEAYDYEWDGDPDPDIDDGILIKERE